MPFGRVNHYVVCMFGAPSGERLVWKGSVVTVAVVVAMRIVFFIFFFLGDKATTGNF